MSRDDRRTRNEQLLQRLLLVIESLPEDANGSVTLHYQSRRFRKTVWTTVEDEDDSERPGTGTDG